MEQANCPFLGTDMQCHKKLAEQMTTILRITDHLVRGPLFTEHVETIKQKLDEPEISLFLRSALQLLIIDSGVWQPLDSLSHIRTIIKDFENLPKQHALTKPEPACVAHMMKVAKQYKDGFEKMDDDDNQINGGIQVSGAAQVNDRKQVDDGNQVNSGTLANDGSRPKGRFPVEVNISSVTQVNDHKQFNHGNQPKSGTRATRASRSNGDYRVDVEVEMKQFPRPMHRVEARAPELRRKKHGCFSRLLDWLMPDA